MDRVAGTYSFKYNYQCYSNSYQVIDLKQTKNNFALSFAGCSVNP